MGKVIRASVVVLLLACSAKAGWIHNDVASTPPSAAQVEQTADGDMQNGLTEAVLTLIESVLALF